MAGFEQKAIPSSLGSRVAILVTGPKALLDSLPDKCRSQPKSVSGVIYGIGHARMEIVAEGQAAALEHLVGDLDEALESVEGAMSRVVWQPPTGGYEDHFPLVVLQPKMKATITLEGDEQTLDYYQRHMRIEAVFNRGLKVECKRLEWLTVTVTGDSTRIKSFIRWCQRGPPLQRADRIQVKWANS
eukprot:CAMPEP_0119310610 /NCGR_PEP_ID=MMETSP1333-20130426/19668_1 /TAXON_ID=418940 /ORGANISM="Scyphosphaera apsteinii, Strain RCC1455" /LENGTH=185 /DNA_ID=CAMNT_0007314825 /DNA_START=258 /DNA_END=815 /DNA_ORIENTATION=+